MAAVLLTEYLTNMRTVLGDQGSNGVYEWKDEPLLAALRGVVEMGLGPADVAVNEAGTSLDPAPATPDSRGYLIFKAALALVGGNTPVGWKTRGMSVTVVRGERQETINHFRRMIHKLETDGDPHGTGGNAIFGVWLDLENELCRTGAVVRVV